MYCEVPVLERRLEATVASPLSSAGKRVAVLAGVATRLAPPFAGGLEAHAWNLASALLDRGHQVTVFGEGGPPGAEVVPLEGDFRPSETARRDISSGPESVVKEHHGFTQVVRHLIREQYDVIHNHSAHHLPVCMAEFLASPMVTTLHTPPTPWLESAWRTSWPAVGPAATPSAVNARSWTPVVPDVAVVPNGIDVDSWSGDGLEAAEDGTAVWFGRIVPEKAPHLAIAAARRAGFGLRLAGPVHDSDYFRDQIAPRLGDGIDYVGHLDQHDLAGVVRTASVALVTPMWPEPFGLVVAEALAAGTPVAGFAAGALTELVTDDIGRLAPAGDVDSLARAVVEAARLDPARCRAVARERFSIARMIDDYERIYAAVA